MKIPLYPPLCLVISLRICFSHSLPVDRRTRDRKVVRVLAGAAREFSSPELTFCADLYSVLIPLRVTVVARKRPWSFCQKCMWQVTPKPAHTLAQTKSEWADYAVQE